MSPRQYGKYFIYVTKGFITLPLFTHSSSLKIFPHNNDFSKDPSNFENQGAKAPTPGNGAPAQAANEDGMKPQKQLKLQYNFSFISETSLPEDLLFPQQFCKNKSSYEIFVGKCKFLAPSMNFLSMPLD